MTFVISFLPSVKSSHKKSICDVCICNSTNILSYISPDCLSLWTIQDGNLTNLSYIQSPSHHSFIKGAFINHQTLAVLTDTHRIHLITKENDGFKLSTHFIELHAQNKTEEVKNLEIIHFQKVGKYIFIMTNHGNIFYINFTLTKIKTRNVTIDSEIIQAQSTSDSLFLLFESGRIAQMKNNDFEYLPLPTSSNFCVDKRTQYINIFTNQKQWQLWSLINLQYIDLVSFPNDHESFGLFSPVTNTCAFFTSDSLKFTYFSKITSSVNIPIHSNWVNSRFPVFDSYGQILVFISPSDNIDHKTTMNVVKLATAASCYSDSLSAPLSSTHVFLPTRESLVPVHLPNGHRASLALFGETALAVSTESSVLILPFSDKICPSVSDGAGHSQLIKSNDILSTNNSNKLKRNQNFDDNSLTCKELMMKYIEIGFDMKWIVLPIDHVRSFAWSSNTLICLSSNGRVHIINITTLHSLFLNENIYNILSKSSTKSNDIEQILKKIKRKLTLSHEKLSQLNSDESQVFSLVDSLLSVAKNEAVDELIKNLPPPFVIQGKPLSISASGNRLLATFSTQLTFYQIDPQKLLSTTSVGKASIRNAVFLSSETIAVLTSDFHLLLIYHTKVLHRNFDDVLAIQLTGSNGWPLFIIGGNKWRLLGANYSELELDFDTTIINQPDLNEKSSKNGVTFKSNSKSKAFSPNDNQEYGYSLMIGVDGFSIVCLDPFKLIDFVHLVVCQSLIANDENNDTSGFVLDSPTRKSSGEIRINSSSLASAVSILSQLTEERRLKILQKVGMKIRTKSSFDRFLSLINRYIEIEDQILSYVIATNTRFNFIDNASSSLNSKKLITIDYVSFFKRCFARGLFLTAAELIKYPLITKTECHQLLIKSDFNRGVVKKFTEKFSSFDDIAEIEGEIINFYRLQFLRNQFLRIASLLPYFVIPMKKFMLKSRRERESIMEGQFSSVIDSMKICTKQQLIDLSSVFEEVNAYDLVFCCSYCANNYSKCIECIEKQQRMMKFIDAEVLKIVGYIK